MAFFVRLVSNKSPLLDVSQAYEIGVYIVATPAVQYVDVPLLRDDEASVGKTKGFRRLTTVTWFLFMLTTLLRLVALLAYDAMSAARVLKVTPVKSTNEFDAILLVMAVALRSGLVTVFYAKLFEWRSPQLRRIVCAREHGRSKSTSSTRTQYGSYGTLSTPQHEIDPGNQSELLSRHSLALELSQTITDGDSTVHGYGGVSAKPRKARTPSRTLSEYTNIVDGAGERQTLLGNSADHGHGNREAVQAVPGALLYS